jgi:hypothetical protein
MIAESLNIPKTVVLRILKEDLGKRKLCARFVSHCLTPEQREDESHLAKTLLQWPMQTKIFLTKLLQEMRSGVLRMALKQSDSSEWVGETSPWLKKLTFQRSHIKIMLIIFFASQGIAHKEFVPEGKTVSAEFYKGVTDRLLKRIQRVRPSVFCS